MKQQKFVITTDSRRKDEILFMVDRRIQKKSFWSNRLDDAFVYGNKHAAEQKAQSFRYNNPRVMTLNHASRIAEEQEQQRQHEETMKWTEAGWDGHKVYGFEGSILPKIQD